MVFFWEDVPDVSLNGILNVVLARASSFFYGIVGSRQVRRVSGRSKRVCSLGVGFDDLASSRAGR